MYPLPRCLFVLFSQEDEKTTLCQNSAEFRKLLAPEDKPVCIPRSFQTLPHTDRYLPQLQSASGRGKQCHQVRDSAVQVHKQSVRLPSSSELNITNFQTKIHKLVQFCIIWGEGSPFGLIDFSPSFISSVLHRTLARA